MANYLIEVPHGEDKRSCIEAMEIFVRTGSHFLANADWGCLDGDHKAFLIVEVDNKEQALQIVPPFYRKNAKITKLMKVTREEVEHYRNEHNLEELDKLHT